MALQRADVVVMGVIFGILALLAVCSGCYREYRIPMPPGPNGEYRAPALIRIPALTNTSAGKITYERRESGTVTHKLMIENLDIQERMVAALEVSARVIGAMAAKMAPVPIPTPAQ